MPSLATASLTSLERRVLDRFVALLESELGDNVHAVWLYGSRARGEQPGEDSDIDVLLLVHVRSDGDQLRALELRDEAAREEGEHVPISVKVFDVDWLRGRRELDSFFIREVDRDKVVLLGSA
jgi:predicted nucleotidyltransferase